MKILITGGFGYLGSYLSKYFENEGHDIYILEKRSKTSITNTKYNYIQADICNIDELRKKIDFEIDYCIHTAAAADYYIENYYKIALEVNTLGTRNLLEIFKSKSLRKFIYISTIHIYGNQKESKITEQLMPNPINDYALSHLFAEYYIKQYYELFKIPYIIFRLTNSYGVPLTYNSTKWYLVLNDLVKTAFEQNKIQLNSNGTASRDFIWQKNVAQVIEKSLYNDKIVNDIYNLGSEKNYSIIDIAEKVKTIFSEIHEKDFLIIINQEDKIKYAENFISCQKLKSVLEYEIDDKIDFEINNIINLLKSSSK